MCIQKIKPVIVLEIIVKLVVTDGSGKVIHELGYYSTVSSLQGKAGRPIHEE